MKKLFVSIAALLALLGFMLPASAARHQNGQKIGMVNVQTILQKSECIKEARDSLKKQFSGSEKKLEAQGASLRANLAKFHKDSAVMKASKRKVLEEKITKEQRALQSEQIGFQRKFVTAQNKLLSSCLQKVRDAVKRSYKVEVASVKMIRLPAKERTIGLHRGATAERKKAVVILKPGQSIAGAQP